MQKLLIDDTSDERGAVDSTSPVHLIEIGRNESISLSVYGVLLSFLAFAAGVALLGDGGVGAPGLLFVTGVLTIVLHELVHGAFFKLFGGQPTFGAGVAHFMPYAYATSAGDRFALRQMVAIAAAPLVVVTTAAASVGVAFPTLAPYAILAIVINVGGAIGDLWMIREMMRFRGLEDVRFVDRRDGVAVHSADPRAIGISAGVSREVDEKGRFGLEFLASTMIFAVISLVVAIALASFRADTAIRIGPPGFALVDYEPTGDGFELGLNFAPCVVAGVLFAVLRQRLRNSAMRELHE